jgi:transcriptional regulator with XRE-family HTH domain
MNMNTYLVGGYRGSVTEPGHQLKRARERARLTSTALADRLGVSQSAVSRWEHGYNRPTLAMAQRLDAILEAGLVEAWYPAPEVVAGATPDVTLVDLDAKLDDVLRAIAQGIGELTNLLRLVHLMETRQRRAFDLMHLDASVDLDDSRLDDPTYRAAFEARPLPPEDPPVPAAAKPKRRRHRQGA